MAHYRRFAEYFGLRSDDVPYTGLSFAHGNALRVTMLPSLFGHTSHSVFSRWFTISRLWAVCAEYGCTTWSNLGGIATGLYAQPPSRLDRAHSVRMVTSAGMPRDLKEPFEHRFGVQVLEQYGTTEAGVISVNRPGEGPVGSFGRPLPDQDVMIVDDVARRSAPATSATSSSARAGPTASSISKIRRQRPPSTSAIGYEPGTSAGWT